MAALAASADVAEQATRGIILFLTGYYFANLAVFGGFIAFQNQNGGRERLSDLAGFARRAPFAALAVMAFLVDFHNPSIWAFAQEVGGKKVGASLGWGNMWGNLGAYVSPKLLGEVARSAGWNAAFVVCGVVFAAAAVLGLMLNATKTVEDEAG